MSNICHELLLFLTMMFTLHKAWEPVQVEGSIVKGSVYTDIWGMLNYLRHIIKATVSLFIPELL